MVLTMVFASIIFLSARRVRSTFDHAVHSFTLGKQQANRLPPPPLLASRVGGGS